jgi:hypothetical protein
MAQLFNANKVVYDQVKLLVTHDHPHLAGILDQIAVLFKEKSPRSGDYAHPVKSRKAPYELIKALTDQEFIFLIEIGDDEWQSASDSQRVAMLSHGLSAFKAEEGENGEMKYKVVVPPIQFYPEELIKHGYWRSPTDPSKVASDEMDTIRQFFGE